MAVGEVVVTSTVEGCDPYLLICQQKKMTVYSMGFELLVGFEMQVLDRVENHLQMQVFTSGEVNEHSPSSVRF